MWALVKRLANWPEDTRGLSKMLMYRKPTSWHRKENHKRGMFHKTCSPQLKCAPPLTDPAKFIPIRWVKYTTANPWHKRHAMVWHYLTTQSVKRRLARGNVVSVQTTKARGQAASETVAVAACPRDHHAHSGMLISSLPSGQNVLSQSTSWTHTVCVQQIHESKAYREDFWSRSLVGRQSGCPKTEKPLRSSATVLKPALEVNGESGWWGYCQQRSSLMKAWPPCQNTFLTDKPSAGILQEDCPIGLAVPQQ